MNNLILGYLARVQAERVRRAESPAWRDMVEALKTYQQHRFAQTYADLLNHPRYAQAAQFFLGELYGPGDFTRRDAQFARVVPALVRLFPRDVVQTVCLLAELHAISEELDSRMALALLQHGASQLDASSYGQAWRQTGSEAKRQRQIDLTLAVGESLDRLTRKPLLRQALRMMRGPAAAAQLNELQQFLERGFDTFQAMKGAREFLGTVRAREESLAKALFSDSSSALAA